MVILIGAAKLTNAEPGNKREMLSVPIQQMARTIYYHGGVNAKDEMGLTNEEWNYINDLFVQGAYTIYQEGISDPVKDLTNTELILNSKRNFLRIYGKLALQYPSDYINAILTLNAGFLSPIDITHANLHAMYNTSGLSYIAIRWNGEEYINYYIGIYKDSKLPTLLEKMERFANNNEYLNFPLLRYFLMPGIYLWLLLYLLVYYIWSKNKDRALVFFYILLFFGTMLLGPCVLLRYIYPIMLVVPYLAIYGIGKNPN